MLLVHDVILNWGLKGRFQLEWLTVYLVQSVGFWLFHVVPFIFWKTPMWSKETRQNDCNGCSSEVRRMAILVRVKCGIGWITSYLQPRRWFRRSRLSVFRFSNSLMCSVDGIRTLGLLVLYSLQDVNLKPGSCGQTWRMSCVPPSLLLPPWTSALSEYKSSSRCSNKAQYSDELQLHGPCFWDSVIFNEVLRPN